MLDLKPRPEDLDAIEVASRDEIAALQLERLKRTLRHAYGNVPHYRKAFDAAGVHPDRLATLGDLARFPFTTKDDLRASYPFGMFAVPREEIVRVHASSGTTGKPTVVGYTKADIETWSEVVARSIRAAGGRPGMKLHNAYCYGLFTGSSLQNLLGGRQNGVGAQAQIEIDAHQFFFALHGNGCGMTHTGPDHVDRIFVQLGNLKAKTITCVLADHRSQITQQGLISGGAGALDQRFVD